MAKVAIVTGAARGIGAGIAHELNRQGYEVLGLDRDPFQASFEAKTCDVADWSQLEKLAQELQKRGVKVAALVHNAAVQVEKSAAETSHEELLRVFNVNLFAIFGLMKFVGPLLERGSAVVNISSVHARATSKGLAAYVASKGAVSALTRALALEWADRGVRINSVGPGAVETEMLRQGLVRSGNEAQARKSLVEGAPLKRIGEPADVAHLVAFLLDSQKAANITGQEFFTDGGVLAALASE